MSDDLISRKEVLAIITSRLNSSKIGSLENQRLYSTSKEVNNLSTAYDMDRVIERLETYIFQQSENEMLSENGKRIVKRVIEECIKIVKSGGVSDD